MAHNHEHGQESGITTGRLVATMLLNFAITIAEVVGGVWSGSLSLLSDALHNFSDGGSIVLTYAAIRMTGRKNSPRHTFGLKRAEILAAFINAAVLLAITLFLFQHAVVRLAHPVPVDGRLMTLVALVGLVANVVGTLLLRSGAASSMNVRSAYLHLLSDAASSVAVVIGGLAILSFEAYWVDPVLTILIGVYVLRESMKLLAESVHVLMEGTPLALDLDALGSAVEALPGVENLHHVHVWTVGEHDVHLSAHVNVRDMPVSEGDGLRQGIEAVLRDSFGIAHATIQIECGQCQGVGLIRT